MIFSIAKTVLKSLFKKPATLMYPVVDRKYSSNTRGALYIEIDKCIFCGICQRKCPAVALEVNRTEKTWTVDRKRCISCSSCVESCPKKCLHLHNKYTEPTTNKTLIETFSKSVATE